MRSAGATGGVLPTWQEIQRHYEEAFAAWDAAGRPDYGTSVLPQPEATGAPTEPPSASAKEPIKAPTNLLEFNEMFPDEKACINYLFRVRWPDGFACPKCGDSRCYWMKGAPNKVQCWNHHRTSMTAGTVMHGSKQPLLLWFHAAFLDATLTPGISALQFQKQLGITRYETAWNMLHKLRAAFVNPDREPLHRNLSMKMRQKDKKV